MTAVGVAVAVAGGMAMASSTTSEGIVSIAPKTISSATGTSLAAGKSIAWVASGGTTTVPSNATHVQFSVTIKNQAVADGTLTVEPYLDPADASGDAVTWGAAKTQVVGTVLEPVGVSNKVSFKNTSSGAIALIVKITGYSTPIRLAARLDLVESKQSSDEAEIAALDTQLAQHATQIAQQGGAISSLQTRMTAVEQVRTGYAASSQTLTAGNNFLLVSQAFVAPRNATCAVTSSVQVYVTTAQSAGTTNIFFRNAMQVDGNTPVEDHFYGHYLVSSGAPGTQPDISRTSTFTVFAGQTVRFGAFLGNVSSAYVSSFVDVGTWYRCD